MRLKSEIYYQYLYDIAVDHDSSSFSVLNAGATFVIPNNGNLVNRGTGENYGVELTLERFLDKGFYFLLTTSMFESKYTGSDGVSRNTAFNGNYVFNLLAGKEWKVGKNNAITFDVKSTYAGGRRYSPVMMDESIAAHKEIRDLNNAYSEQYKPYFRTDMKLGFRMNGSKIAQAFYLDIRNVTNNQNVFVENFNNRNNKVETVYQTGFFPIFLWQLWF
jgi:outer membrane receptor protein involved in Fe transport